MTIGNSNILSEAGTNELEILVFKLLNNTYGINLAKVREIIKYHKTTKIPYSAKEVEGVFELRDSIIPLINLKKWLNNNEEYDKKKSKIIISKFFGIKTGLWVDDVERIYRVSWKNIYSSDKLTKYSNVITGTIEINNKLILMLDYENIHLTLKPHLLIKHNKKIDMTDHTIKEIREKKEIWIVDDSAAMRNFIREILNENGYSNLKHFENGKQASNFLLSIINSSDTNFKLPDLIISDIEMPVMDGYTLTKIVKTNKELKKIPVIIFSSLISSNNKIKGEMVNADLQLSKADSEELVPAIDNLIL